MKNVIHPLSLCVLVAPGFCLASVVQAQPYTVKIYDYSYATQKPSAPSWVNTQPPSWNVDAFNGYDAAVDVYWFFNDKFSRYSWDDAGGDINIYVNYGWVTRQRGQIQK